MRYFTFAMLLASQALLAQGETGGSRDQEGPCLPGDAGGWMGSPEVSNAWLIRMRRDRSGPTGSCQDPNPHPENGAKGFVLVMGSEPNGTNEHPIRKGDDGPRKTRRVAGEIDGPQGMDCDYYVSLTNDHYAGTSHS